MTGKLVFSLIFVGSMLANDVPAYKKARFRERIVYGLLWAPLLYLDFVFIADKRWPNLNTLFDLLAGPGAQIVKLFKA